MKFTNLVILTSSVIVGIPIINYINAYRSYKPYKSKELVYWSPIDDNGFIILFINLHNVTLCVYYIISWISVFK